MTLFPTIPDDFCFGADSFFPVVGLETFFSGIFLTRVCSSFSSSSSSSGKSNISLSFLTFFLGNSGELFCFLFRVTIGTTTPASLDELRRLDTISSSLSFSRARFYARERSAEETLLGRNWWLSQPVPAASRFLNTGPQSTNPPSLDVLRDDEDLAP